MFCRIKVSVVWILVASMTLSGCAGMQQGGKGSAATCMAMYTLGGAVGGAVVGGDNRKTTRR